MEGSKIGCFERCSGLALILQPQREQADGRLTDDDGSDAGISA
jgi:hypothetical protein